MSKERSYYSKEFKLKAIELSYSRDNAREVAEELGIRPGLLYKWRANLLTDGVRSFTGNGNKKQSPEEKEIAFLKRQVRAS